MTLTGGTGRLVDPQCLLQADFFGGGEFATMSYKYVTETFF